MEYFSNCMNSEELEKEHKRLVIKMHPDRNPDNPNATAEFQEMQAQYEERKAELKGDYSKSRQGRERRERERKEREERERKEKARRKVEQAISKARENRQKSFLELKAGDYIYARMVNFTRRVFGWNHLSTDELLEAVLKAGLKDECVVNIEMVITMTDDELLTHNLSDYIPDGIWGGYDVLQAADPAAGVRKGKRVAKVMMFRSPQYCVFGNPMGDAFISDYYVSANYETLFSERLDNIKARLAYERQEQDRIEAELRAKKLAEQQPLIDEWADKLISLSAGLSLEEQKEVAASNFRTMLKKKFPKVKFGVKKERNEYFTDYSLKYEDGPTKKEIMEVVDLFGEWMGEKTPWAERFGSLFFSMSAITRKMSTIAKARILQQLGQVSIAFSNSGYDDEVEVNDFDWMMLHLLVGVDVNNPGRQSLCINILHADGRRTVRVSSAVNYVFNLTSYCKENVEKKKKTVA